MDNVQVGQEVTKGENREYFSEKDAERLRLFNEDQFEPPKPVPQSKVQ
ncbi:hypothetical protein SCOR_27210 [Sulfidibacter corallicola]|uniref:Uncharacterized protein n=1 Tax=Sulfidibacter corallicola TaxID=2818388 RepID=A0A8A4TMT5_SULCO|nr:hypothetical protein [Sulfidibacter corallicola]QTD50757.1 hypothetical protein J3U87_34670 [Sulfidibacter corallicola]